VSVSECDREASIMRRPRPTGGCCAMGGKNKIFYPEDGDNRFLYNVGKHVPNSAARNPKDGSPSTIN
jgi:hypothetical protein